MRIADGEPYITRGTYRGKRLIGTIDWDRYTVIRESHETIYVIACRDSLEAAERALVNGAYSVLLPNCRECVGRGGEGMISDGTFKACHWCKGSGLRPEGDITSFVPVTGHTKEEIKRQADALVREIEKNE